MYDDRFVRGHIYFCSIVWSDNLVINYCPVFASVSQFELDLTIWRLGKRWQILADSLE